MTQDTNNQEWWVEELETEFPLPKILAFSRKGFKRDKLIALIRKISQKAFNDGVDCMDRVHKGSDAEYQRGREDALKECLEEVIGALKTKECKGISCSEHYHRLKDSLKSKLPPKQ